MTPPGTIKRFYDDAGCAAAEGGFQITLDGRSAKTPAGNALVAPTEALARAVAAEWAAQGAEVAPATMPLTGLLGAARDRDARERGTVVAALARYAETDLVCYRADGPADLAERQRSAWQPLLDWAADALGAPLDATEGVLPITQPADALGRFGDAVAGLDDIQLTALSAVTRATGSLVVGLALVMGHLDADRAVEVAFLDERWQSEQWGDDAEAMARRLAIEAEIAGAARFLALATGETPPD